MEVLKLIDNYIERLGKAELLTKHDLELLIEEITEVVLDKNDIAELHLNINFMYVYGDEELLADVQKLKAKLEYKRALMLDENMFKAEQNQREVEKLRLQIKLDKEKSVVSNIENVFNNTMIISFEDARKANNVITSLSENEIKEIQDKINSLEKILNSKADKNKKSLRAKEIIKWIADKCVDVAIALLPLTLKI